MIVHSVSSNVQVRQLEGGQVVRGKPLVESFGKSRPLTLSGNCNRLHDNISFFCFLYIFQLEGAQMLGVKMVCANLEGANLKGANFEVMSFHWVYLCFLKMANFDEIFYHITPCVIDSTGSCRQPSQSRRCEPERCCAGGEHHGRDQP